MAVPPRLSPNLGGIVVKMNSDLVVELVVLLGVLLVGCYCTAYALVRSGRIVVYSGWGDFLKSVAWVLVLPIGIWLGCAKDPEISDEIRSCGWALAAIGLMSLGWLFYAAFKFNGSFALGVCALGARIVTALLVLLLLAKVNERLREKKNDGRGIGDLVVPVAILYFVYRFLVAPMIGTQRRVSSETGL